MADICHSKSKTFRKNRKSLPKQNKNPKSKIPLTVTYNPTLANVKEAIKTLVYITNEQQI